MPFTHDVTKPPIPDRQWMEIASAPFDSELELAVMDRQGTHRLVFPCYRILGGWMNAATRERLANLQPTHWRMWRASD